MYIQVVHICPKHVLVKRGEYASAYVAELRSAFLPSSAVQTPRSARPKTDLQTTSQNSQKLEYFKNPVISQLFREYHLQHAQLRLISKPANLKEL